jgi:hypothetical protein
LNEQIAAHPELFPPEISQGYWLTGFVYLKRMDLKTRRILLKANRQAYQIHPDTVMPFMIGKTEDVEKGLYHEHWLKNLLIAASLNDRNTGKFVSHKAMEN